MYFLGKFHCKIVSRYNHARLDCASDLLWLQKKHGILPTKPKDTQLVYVIINLHNARILQTTKSLRNLTEIQHRITYLKTKNQGRIARQMSNFYPLFSFYTRHFKIKKNNKMQNYFLFNLTGYLFE